MAFLAALRWRVSSSGFRASFSSFSNSFTNSFTSSSGAVTRHNFAEALQQLKEHLTAADYVAIDLEMSGVHSAPWRRSLDVDTLETRYQNIRDSGEKFSIFQCGVCLFRYDSKTAKFVAYPYNFYLFPRNEHPLNIARDFLCQTSSLEFLAKHQFDFNTCIYNGISYLSREQEDAARAHLEKKSEEVEPDLATRKTSDVLFCERARLQVGLWRSTKVMGKQKKESSEVSESSLPCLLVNVADKRQAQLVILAVTKYFSDLVPVLQDSETDTKQVKVIYAGSERLKASLERKMGKAEVENRESMLMDSVGFRLVIDAIADSKKPVVGHNCTLDLAHFHSKFIGPLPDNYSSFSSTIHKLFPCILDTKYMLKAEPSIRKLGMPGTSLSSAFAFFFGQGPSKHASKKPFPRVKVDIADNFPRYSDAVLKHEAGYDAYMTGAIFAQIWRLLTADSAQSFLEQIQSRKPLFKAYANLLYMGWSGHYVLDISSGKEAAGKKALPDRLARTLYDGAVLVWSHSAAVPSGRLKKLVTSCFAGTKFSPEVEVVPIDETSAFLVFYSPPSLEAFVKASEENAGTDQLKKISAQITAAGLKVSRFEAFEKLCQSSISARRLSDAIEMLKDFSEGEDDTCSDDDGEAPELIIYSPDDPQDDGQVAKATIVGEHLVPELHLIKAT